MELKDIKRPSRALIKLVEAAGILLRVPKQTEKSVYKAPIPTNYDNTIELLARDFYGTLQQLVEFDSHSISNETAAEVLSKFYEPGFCYDNAFRDGSHYARELYNVVILLLDRLKEDSKRLPVRTNDVFILVNGSKASYVALDTASHVFSHGVLTVGAVCDSAAKNAPVPSEGDILSQYLVKDIKRRCENLYKVDGHKYQIIDVFASSEQEIFDSAVQTINEYRPSVFVVGCADENFEDDCQDKLKLWAAWEFPSTTVFTKTKSRTRPFSLSHASRSFMFCIKKEEDVAFIFERALVCLRPGDNVVVFLITESSDPNGNWRHSRFENGVRQGWIKGSASTVTKSFPGWNAESNERLVNNVNSHISAAKITGKVVVIPTADTLSIPQQICRCAIEEGVEFIVMKYMKQKNNIINVLKESTCSVILVK